MRRILIIDDDIHIGNLLEEALLQEGYLVSRAYSGTEALLMLDRERLDHGQTLAAVRPTTGPSGLWPDLVLLDLMLPGLSGEEVLSRLAGVPVIVVSAKADPDHKAELLLGGAVDYVTKPFSLKELSARIALRLREAPAEAELRFGPIVLDRTARWAKVDGIELRLTRTEYAILKLLMDNPAHVVTKSVLLDRIAQDTPDCTESSLKTHMSNLRKKLRDAGAGECIESVWGIGFKMKQPVL